LVSKGELLKVNNVTPKGTPWHKARLLTNCGGDASNDAMKRPKNGKERNILHGTPCTTPEPLSKINTSLSTVFEDTAKKASGFHFVDTALYTTKQTEC